jgi:hypothetical protein
VLLCSRISGISFQVDLHKLIQELVGLRKRLITKSCSSEMMIIMIQDSFFSKFKRDRSLQPQQTKTMSGAWRFQQKR